MRIKFVWINIVLWIRSDKNHTVGLHIFKKSLAGQFYLESVSNMPTISFVLIESVYDVFIN